ncbi:hypothetical protein C4D60_Mb07t22580 [Musa balbisiana]|uniref:non-specific serine/threonine protein kinase n=1 Tax=Musa balbisiana TaxID=52838 RepID=A0A4S8JJR1_MUSBA|nr:hypothetical protein C4D60_Mb07t22580 [Musa balbisiana]
MSPSPHSLQLSHWVLFWYSSMRAKKCSTLVFWSAFFLFWAAGTALLSPKGVNFEVQALMGIKASLMDPHSVLENWDQDSVDPCSWTMVTCSPENLVVGLATPSQNLSGTLSPSIGNLTNLKILFLQNNNMSGPIPPEIGKLSKLQTIDLSNNYFSGEIPNSLGNLNNLQYMRLNNNSLSGAFPESLANLPQLAFLDLSYNNLSGTIPKIPARTFNFGAKMLWNDAYVEHFLHLWPIFHNLLFDQHHEEVSLGNLKRFQFRELQIATNNFSSKNILGHGGFGNVYRGQLQDGTLVAIKRLKDGNAAGGEMQFKTEVEMISLAVHRNLLRLLGFCMTATERLLIYPYMSNGSVASRLKDVMLYLRYITEACSFLPCCRAAKPTLDWSTRKRIALGAARGLLYLHEQCDPKIIHRDVKAANILLDDYCEAVVGDFGLAKLLDHRDSHVTTAVRGTVGHIAPEYLSTGQSSEKTDVRKIHQEKSLDMLVDRDLKNNYDRVEVEEIIQVVILCTQYLPGHRPKMSEVVRMLEGDGLAERWEASRRIEAHKLKVPEIFSEQYSDITDDSSLLIDAIELSGPR